MSVLISGTTSTTSDTGFALSLHKDKYHYYFRISSNLFRELLPNNLELELRLCRNFNIFYKDVIARRVKFPIMKM